VCAVKTKKSQSQRKKKKEKKGKIGKKETSKYTFVTWSEGISTPPKFPFVFLSWDGNQTGNVERGKFIKYFFMFVLGVLNLNPQYYMNIINPLAVILHETRKKGTERNGKRECWSVGPSTIWMSFDFDPTRHTFSIIFSKFPLA
jgi:hypothetical protein